MSTPFLYEVAGEQVLVTDWILDGEIPIQLSRLEDVALCLRACDFSYQKKELFKEADEYLDGYNLAKWVVESKVEVELL